MYKKFSEKMRGEITKAFGKHAKFIVDMKDGSDNGTFEVIITKQVKDRDGEIVLIDGINTENFMKNPVVLFAHNYYDLPVGKCTELVKESDQYIAKGVFASAEANPFAQNVRKLYDAGFLSTTSIGFIPKQYEGNLITECELLEFSFVPVPANPEALSLLSQVKERGLQKELAMVFKTTEKSGVKLSESYQNFIKEVDQEVEDKKEEEEKKEEDEKKNISEELKAFKEAVREGFKLLADEVKSIDKNLTEKMVELQGLVVKGESQSDEHKAELESVLKDTHQKAQLIDKIVNQVNENLRKFKETK